MTTEIKNSIKEVFEKQKDFFGISGPYISVPTSDRVR